MHSAYSAKFLALWDKDTALSRMEGEHCADWFLTDIERWDIGNNQDIIYSADTGLAVRR